MKVLFLLLSSCCLLFAADTIEQGSRSEKKALDWTFTPDPNLPNVLIIGDSISIGYTLGVRELLKGKANVYRPMASANKVKNAGGTSRGLTHVDKWVGDTKWDVIHFNFGLHDLKHYNHETRKNSNDENMTQQTPVAEYEKNMEVITEKLEKTNAKLIFATTTPIVPGTTNPLRKPEYPVEYNEAALRVMKKHSVTINDLFALTNPVLADVQIPKNCHFKAVGNKLMAEQVALKIVEALSDNK